jgi:hypothetical protein
MADFSGSTSSSSTNPSGNAPTAGDSSSQRAGGILDKVRETATDQLATQKDRATDGLGSVAQFVRQSTQQLRDQKQDAIAGYVEQVADQIERFSHSLREKDISELLDDAQQLARKQPAFFIGGAFVLGLVGARFLKSSGQANERTYRSGNRDGNGDRNRTPAYPGDASGSFGSGSEAGQYGGTSASIGSPSAGSPRGLGNAPAERL